MVNSVRKKVAIGCQGGGMHAAFAVGVLKAILERSKATPDPNKTETGFELMGLSGTSAGALCALMAWYGLAPIKNGRAGSADEAIRGLERFWENFVAITGAETVLNALTYGAIRAEESEVPVLGLYAPIFGLNPRGAIYKAVAACLPRVGVRRDYFDLEDTLAKACPEFNSIDWPNVKTRLLIGATEVVNGFETVFDSDVNKGMGGSKSVSFWHQQLPLSLSGVAASGTLPAFREAQYIKGAGYYWDGLYSQNPPVHEFVAEPDKAPDELWIVRINPQQWPELPKTNAEIQDRQNELMGNLSLHKELDFILKVNAWRDQYKGNFADDQKDVIVRTIK
ncbi:MAG: patatin-like phospholipase family protein, partial [Pseudolabrys sp.]